ncbi:MAG: (2Fe-2S)-binding protein [Dehalococcoidia bacterium]
MTTPETNAHTDERIVVTATINGDERSWLSSSRDSLLEALRERLNLTGAKEGCNNGNCGACSVILDGRLVNSCLVMAAEVEGSDVTTVEGLAEGQELHPLQKAFLTEAALQCGICTPGFLVASKALLDEHPAPSEEEIRFWLAGNLCRCTGYNKIIEAVQTAAAEMAGG